MLTSAQSYDDAINQLKQEALSAPVYFISAGSQPNQGAIITRDRNFLRKFLPLNVSLTLDPNSWYLLETNYVRCKIAIAVKFYSYKHALLHKFMTGLS